MRPEEEQVLTIRCRFCWAGPGQWCRTTSGKTAHLLHLRRRLDWQDGRSQDGPTGFTHIATQEEQVIAVPCRFLRRRSRRLVPLPQR